MLVKPVPKPANGYERKFKGSLPPHWRLLAEIIKAHNAYNFLYRDDLMAQLAQLTGQAQRG